MERNTGRNKIVLAFALFAALFALNFLVPPLGGVGYTSRMWLVLDACVTLLSVVLLVKNKLPGKSRILLSLFLGLLMFAAYQGVSFSSVKGFVTTALCALASFRVFEKFPARAVPVAAGRTPKAVAASLLLGVVAGGVLGSVNLLLSGGAPLRFQFSLSCLLVALSPAVLEEICYRLVLYAFCLEALGGNIRSRADGFWCYLMMVLPHVLIHTPDMLLSYGVASWVINTAILLLLFGIPFALLQRKRDLLSAMVGHGLVDAIRFTFLGLPM